MQVIGHEGYYYPITEISCFEIYFDDVEVSNFDSKEIKDIPLPVLRSYEVWNIKVHFKNGVSFSLLEENSQFNNVRATLEKFLCELHFNNEHRFIAFDELTKLFVRGIPVWD